MSEKQKGQYYQQALELVKKGDNQKALQCLLEHLKSCPEDSEALNDIGAVCYCMGRTEQAIEYLEKAKKLDPESGEICWNLTEAYLSANMPSWAVGQFKDLERFGLTNFDLYNRTAKLFVDSNDKANAIEMLLKSLEVAPNQDLLYPMLEVLKCKRPNVGFFCENKDQMKSVKDTMDFISKRFNLKFYYTSDCQKVANVLTSTDIAWFQSAGKALAEISQSVFNTKIIVNLTESDLYGDVADSVNWKNIDKVFVPDKAHVKKLIGEKLPMIEMETSVCYISNGINMERYQLQNTIPSKNLVCLDSLDSDANPMLLIQCMQKLNYIDKDYKLFFAGSFKDQKLEKYMRYLVRQLKLDGCVFFDNCKLDLSELLENKSYIVSASISQNDFDNILKAMACGLKPVVHNCPGVSEFLDNRYLYNIAEEFCEMIVCPDNNPAQYRNFVKQWYPQKNQFAGYNKVFVEFEKEIEKGIGISAESVNTFRHNLESKLEKQNSDQFGNQNNFTEVN